MDNKPDRAKISDMVIAIVAERFAWEVTGITTATDFAKDLNADSLDNVEMIMVVEDAFDLKIPDEDAERIGTVGALIAYVDWKINGATIPDGVLKPKKVIANT